MIVPVSIVSVLPASVLSEPSLRSMKLPVVIAAALMTSAPAASESVLRPASLVKPPNSSV